MMYGVWGGRKPGGWCNIYLPSEKVSSYFATEEQAKASAKNFRTEYPSNEYEAVPFDFLREPPSFQDHATPTQLRALKLLLDERMVTSHWFIQVKQVTVEALHRRGWVHYRIMPDGKDSRIAITAAGRRAIEEAR